MDPTVSVSAADLSTQLDYALKLRNMQSAVASALLALDSLKEQLQQAEKTVKDRMSDAPKELTATLAESLKQVAAIQGRLGRPPDAFRLEVGPRLAENLGSLFFSIDGVNAAPTGAQQGYFNELQTEFREKMAEVNGFLTKTAPQWNETLRKLGAPTVVAGKAIELP